jgi:hypothetical protein
MVLGIVDTKRHLKWLYMFCEALVVLRFRHLGHNFLKSGDFTDTFISKRYFVKVRGC